MLPMHWDSAANLDISQLLEAVLERVTMRELTRNEIEQVSGGLDGPTTVATGAAVGTVGAGTGAIVAGAGISTVAAVAATGGVLGGLFGLAMYAGYSVVGFVAGLTESQGGRYALWNKY